MPEVIGAPLAPISGVPVIEALLLCHIVAGCAGGRLVRPVLLGESLTGLAQSNVAPAVESAKL